MNIYEMNKRDFEELPYINIENSISIDSIILLPTNNNTYHTTYQNFVVIGCVQDEPIGKLREYDTFSIFTNTYTRIGVDCLHKSKLMRIFLPSDNFILNPTLHIAEQTL